MMPRNMDPRMVKKMMKQLGIKTEEMDDVEEVIIRTSEKEYCIRKAQVTMVEAQGQKTFQVVGNPEVRARGAGGERKKEEGGAREIPEEDIALVAEKAGVSEEEARKALEECDGEPAEAIIKLMSR